MTICNIDNTAASGKLKKTTRITGKCLLQRCQPRAAQQQDDAKTGKAEKKYKQRRCRDGGRQQRQGHFQQRTPTRGAKRIGGLAQMGVKLGPEAAHRAGIRDPRL